jgi:hypothetical protein
MHALSGTADPAGLADAEVFVQTPVSVERDHCHVVGIIMNNGLSRLPTQDARL